jgi:uncharacterized protein
MHPDDVAKYLRTHPRFFEEHADLLAQIQVPNPHSGRAIPLSDRQVISLREKNRVLEGKLTELIQFGEENDALSEKVHGFAVGLVRAPDFKAVLAFIRAHLRDDFQVPHAALRLWCASGDAPEFSRVTDGLRAHADRMARPECGAAAGLEVADWFSVSAEHIRSVAIVPLRSADAAFGLLVLASEDAKRFYPEMGTVYLGRIGDLAGAALARHL